VSRSAFPSILASEDAGEDPINKYSGGGLTVREYFAAAALTGILSNAPALDAIGASNPDGGQFAMIDLAYELADTMIERGNK